MVSNVSRDIKEVDHPTKGEIQMVNRTTSNIGADSEQNSFRQLFICLDERIKPSVDRKSITQQSTQAVLVSQGHSPSQRQD